MPPRPHRIAGPVLLCLLAGVHPPAVEADETGEAAPFAAAELGWTKLSYKARKLLMTARSEISIAAVTAQDAVAALIGPADEAALLPAQAQPRLLTLTSQMLGRNSTLQLWFDGRDADAWQRVQLETGSRNRYKGYRFLDEGVYSLRKTPRRGEDKLAHGEWSDVSEGVDTYPIEVSTVTEPAALFYILSAAPLSEPGDVLEINAYSKSELMAVQLRVVDRRNLRVDYEEIGPAGRRKVNGQVETLRLSVTGRPLEGDADPEEFEFLGLHGDIEVYLDPSTRVPLQVSGDLPIVGGVDVRLQSIELAARGAAAAADGD